MKDLPRGKNASYRSAVQKITTYETSSKAPLIEKGRGLSADLDKKLRK
jgi:molybdenum-dependent DNA-binding transcriptional regulator ModE